MLGLAMARSGREVERVPAYRRMTSVLFERRNEAVVYFEEALELSQTLAFLERWNLQPHAHLTLFSLLLFALARTLHQHPRLNRFIAGAKLHQRDGVWLSYTVKRSMEAGAHLRVVKRRFEATETLLAFATAQQQAVDTARSAQQTYTDRETALLLKLPHPLLTALTRLATVADSLNLLPASFLRNDPFFTSAFLSNLGSVGGSAAFHHLYEYGDCPLFLTLGKVSDEVLARDGQAVVRPVARLKVAYDERIEDGFNALRAFQALKHSLEHPETLTAQP